MPSISWPHAPTHQLSEGGTFIVTAGTYLKAHHFRQPTRLDVLHRGLLTVAANFGWQLEAWAIFSNHYHFVGHSPPESDASSLEAMLSNLHAKTAGWINRLDGVPGRKVWHNYRETRLTYRLSYLARLHYVHANAVKHGLVATPAAYPWCSAALFERSVSTATVASIYRLKIDKVRVFDDFNPVPPG